MRRNIDAWWPLAEGLDLGGRVEAIVVNALRLRRHRQDYGRALAHDPAYAQGGPSARDARPTSC